MRRLLAAIVSGLIVLVLGAGPASAQMIKMPEWTDKGFINVNAAVQPVGQDINNSIIFLSPDNRGALNTGGNGSLTV